MKRIKFLPLVCALALAGCGNTQQNTQSEKDTYYETMTISLGDRTLTTGYSAAISGVQTVEIRPQVSGMITDILIEEGESVRKDQILCQASSWVEARNSACLSRCHRGERPLVEL